MSQPETPKWEIRNISFTYQSWLKNHLKQVLLVTPWTCLENHFHKKTLKGSQKPQGFVFVFFFPSGTCHMAEAWKPCGFGPSLCLIHPQVPPPCQEIPGQIDCVSDEQRNDINFIVMNFKQRFVWKGRKSSVLGRTKERFWWSGICHNYRGRLLGLDSAVVWMGASTG